MCNWKVTRDKKQEEGVDEAAFNKGTARRIDEGIRVVGLCVESFACSGQAWEPVMVDARIEVTVPYCGH